MMEERRLLISFSGGETSALMAKLCVERLGNEYDKILTVFANTGQENEATLRFVQLCDKAFGLGVHWVEAVVDPEKGKGVRCREVTFETADRTGAVFESLIAKYGIPNKAHPHCTKDLKERPIKDFARRYGWEPGTYDLAIGIRDDEVDRISPAARARRIVYPLIKRWPHRKNDVNEFWHGQPFRLELKGYQGNCKWCWKKTLRKHLTLITETPEVYEFPERMERDHGLAGNNPEGRPRVFFRDNRSVGDLRQMAATTKFDRVEDDARTYQMGLFEAGWPEPLDELDLADGCDDGCEVDFGGADE